MLAQQNHFHWLDQIDAESKYVLLFFGQLSLDSQHQALVKLKTQITNEVEYFEMISDRKSYLLHQLANCRDLPSLMELIRDINLAQLQQKPTLFLVRNDEQIRPLPRDLLFIEMSSEGPFFKTKHF
jgi:hypothetical protein